MSKQCPYCGNPVSDSALLCPKCGNAVTDINVAPAPQESLYKADPMSVPHTEKFRQENEVKYITKDDGKKKKSAGKKVLTAIIIILVIAALGMGGFLAYQKFFADREPELDYSVKTLVIDPVEDSEGYELKLNNLADYTSLEELTIKNLDNIDTDALAKAIGTSTTIKKLALTNDGISDVTFITGMTALESLDLSESDSVKWGDVAEIKDAKSDLLITFTTEWSRALAAKAEEYLATVSSTDECTAYITDADDNGIPEIAIGKGTAWNYPSLYITYENGQVISFVSVFQQMFDMSGSGDNSAHFTIWKGSSYVQAEVYDDSSYSTAVWCVEDGMYILKGTATQNVTEDDDNPYFKNTGNIVLDVEGAEVTETTTEAATEETTAAEDTSETSAEEETTEAPKAVTKLDIDAVRAAALEQLIPDYADYQQLSFEELCHTSGAVDYLESYLFETLDVKQADTGEETSSAVLTNLTAADVVSGYTPDGILSEDGADAEAAKELMNNFKLYYTDSTGDYAVKGEPTYIGTAEVYDWTDYDRTGSTHTEYLFGDKTSEGTFRDTAYFVNTSDNSIVKVNRNTDNVMVWKNGKGADIDAAAEFFNSKLGIEGTPMVTVDGLYSIFYENGERSGNIYTDWSFSRAWFSDGTDTETDVYPEDASGILS